MRDDHIDLIGPNGAGVAGMNAAVTYLAKSTLIRRILGDIAPNSGEVHSIEVGISAVGCRAHVAEH